MPTLTKYIYATKVNLNGGGHHTVTKTETLRTVLVEGHGDDPGVMVMTLLSHSMTFLILSPYKFGGKFNTHDPLMTLLTEIGVKP
jgi:hypothetical protein